MIYYIIILRWEVIKYRINEEITKPVLMFKNRLK